MGLSKAELLAKASRLPTERVSVPELDGTVFLIKGMTGEQRDAWETSLVRGRGNARKVDTLNIRAKLVSRCLFWEDGARVYEDAEAGELGQWRVDVLQRLFEIAQRLSGVSDKDADELEQRSADATAG
jgi:hypothetical protein